MKISSITALELAGLMVQTAHETGVQMGLQKPSLESKWDDLTPTERMCRIAVARVLLHELRGEEA